MTKTMLEDVEITSSPLHNNDLLRHNIFPNERTKSPQPSLQQQFPIRSSSSQHRESRSRLVRIRINAPDARGGK